MDQNTFQWIVGGLCLIGGTLLNILYNNNTRLTDRICTLEVIIAGDYVKEQKFEAFRKDIFELLNKIDHKLDGKVDKEK